jgi:hypothetical protein
MPDIDREHEERIRTRAYFLWQEAGSPEGRAEEFWHQARRLELEEGEAADRTNIESFPASDPSSDTPAVGPRSPANKAKK